MTVALPSQQCHRRHHHRGRGWRFLWPLECVCGSLFRGEMNPVEARPHNNELFIIIINQIRTLLLGIQDISGLCVGTNSTTCFGHYWLLHLTRVARRGTFLPHPKKMTATCVLRSFIMLLEAMWGTGITARPRVSGRTAGGPEGPGACSDPTRFDAEHGRTSPSMAIHNFEHTTWYCCLRAWCPQCPTSAAPVLERTTYGPPVVACSY